MGGATGMAEMAMTRTLLGALWPLMGSAIALFAPCCSLFSLYFKASFKFASAPTDALEVSSFNFLVDKLTFPGVIT